MHSAIGMWVVPFFLLMFLQDFIGRMIGIEVQCLLLCKLNNQKKSYTNYSSSSNRTTKKKAEMKKKKI